MHIFDLKSQSLCLWCVKPKYHDSGIFDLFVHHPYLCHQCQKLIKQPIKFKLENLQCKAIVEYSLDIERLIYRFKEDKDIPMAPAFYYSMKKTLKKHNDWVFVVMPSSISKTTQRGFLPLELMLKPYTSNVSYALKKTSDIKQAKQSKNKRKNIHHDIVCENIDQFKDKRIVLIDDVATTGATLLSAYNLLTPYAKEIKAIVFAVHPLLVRSIK